MASTEGERYAASTAHPPVQALPTAPSGALSQSPEPSMGRVLSRASARSPLCGGDAGPCPPRLKCFAVLMPAGRQTTLYQDLTQTTPADIDAWIAAAFQQGLAPGTIVTYRQLQGLLWLPVSPRGPGAVAHSAPTPSHSRAHAAPPADGGSRDRRVLSGDRCAGRPHDVSVDAALWARVSEVSHVRWEAIDMVQGTLRVNTSKGQVDRVVYLSPDVATALRQWHGLQSATADYVFPEPDAPQGRPAARGSANPQPHDPLPEAGRDHQALCAPLAAAYLCHPAPQCRRLAGGGQRTHGAPLAPDDPPLYPAL